MTKVITYGTYDLLHYGHIRLLKRAKELGDYLIVGVTADDFDKSRGKINVQQSLMERVEAVKATGIADEIIIEEYEGQKIDDIRRLDVDIFTVGSDWIGKFDYLNEYCKVVYLDRTEGVSSSDIRSEKRKTRFGLVGESHILAKFENECSYVNGIDIVGCYSERPELLNLKCQKFYNSFESLMNDVDALYIISHPTKHYEQCKIALQNHKHIICESPIALNRENAEELFAMAEENGCVLLDGIKTAYSTAFSRLLLLVKSGRIGKVLSVDATCTSLENLDSIDYSVRWNSSALWGPTAMLPIFEILGTDFNDYTKISKTKNQQFHFDTFTIINYTYDDAVASIKIGNGIKSEGELIISGEKGYIYVPAPWWKTDYFEVRYEDITQNRRYFYQLDGEGIRYEITVFLKMLDSFNITAYIDKSISMKICEMMDADGKYFQ